jgi:hypothetical protein
MKYPGSSFNLEQVRNDVYDWQDMFKATA